MLDIILLIIFGLLGAIALSLFVNILLGKKLYKEYTGIVFDIGKYTLLAFVITISIKHGSIIGIVIFVLATIGVIYLGRNRH